MAATSSDLSDAASQLTNATWRGRAFGLDVLAPTHLLGIPDAPSEDGSRRTMFHFASTGEVDAGWQPDAAKRVFERVFANGKPMLTVDYDGARGYRVWAPHHGRHVVTLAGDEVFSAPPIGRGWWWQRLVAAQVLPIAATLQGLELLHASAVVVAGRAVAITAAAGSGKTSLAAHLLDLDADLLADDVLALEVADGRVIAHPGSSLVNVDPRQRRLLGARAARQLKEIRGRGDDGYALAQVAPGAVPLGVVYFLHRSAEFDTASIVAVTDPRPLLGSTFVSYLDSPARLQTHLEVYGAIAESVPTFVMRAPLDVPAAQLARGARTHLEEIA